MKLFFSFLFLFPWILWGQYSATQKEEVKRTQEYKGWKNKLKVSGSGSLSSNKQVIGQGDGDSIHLGAKIQYEFSNNTETYEWRNQLQYSGVTSKSTSIPKFVKSEDKLKYSSIYLRPWRSYPQIGPYISASVESSLFKGEDHRAKELTYKDITNSVSYANLSSFRLTDPFRPFTTKEAIGFFYKWKQEENNKLELRFGVGAIQVNSQDQYQVTKESETEIEIKQLENFSQVGFEYGLSWVGKYSEESSYFVLFDFLTPIGKKIETPGEECYACSSFQLTNMELSAGVSTKLSTWTSIAYEYKAVLQPQLLNQFQIAHGLVFKFDFVR